MLLGSGQMARTALPAGQPRWAGSALSSVQEMAGAGRPVSALPVSTLGNPTCLQPAVSLQMKLAEGRSWAPNWLPEFFLNHNFDVSCAVG